MTTSAEKLRSLKIGQLLLVETNVGELLCGTLKTINTKYLTIELDNVQDIKTKYTYNSPQLLAYTSMKTIKVIASQNKVESQSENVPAKFDPNILAKNLEDSVDDISTTSSATTRTKGPTTSQEINDDLILELSDFDLQFLQKQLDSTIFITQTDHKYHKALNDIQSQPVIGLVIDPIQMGRNCRTSLIAISTTHNIYIFDMLALGKVFEEMRSILQAERPRKAVHFSHTIADHLKYRHNVILKGIFDTFLAYCVVKNQKTYVTLEETIQKIFNLSEIYFKADDANESPAISYQRPMPQTQLLIIAKKVAFQLRLYDHLLHQYMLKNFYAQCEAFSQTFYSNNDNFLVAQQLQPSSRAGYEHIELGENWKEMLSVKSVLSENQEHDLDSSFNSVNICQ